MADIPLVVGGTIPDQDIAALTGLGSAPSTTAARSGTSSRACWPWRRVPDGGAGTAARSDHHRLRHPGQPLVRAAGGTRPPAGWPGRAAVHPRPVRVHLPRAGSGPCASSPGSAPRKAPTRGSGSCSAGADRAVGRVRPAHPARLRLRPRHGQGEVGRVGVAIDSADDMADLFAGLPLDELSVNFTINATAPSSSPRSSWPRSGRACGPDQLTGTCRTTSSRNSWPERRMCSRRGRPCGSPRTWSSTRATRCRGSTRFP